MKDGTYYVQQNCSRATHVAIIKKYDGTFRPKGLFRLQITRCTRCTHTHSLSLYSAWLTEIFGSKHPASYFELLLCVLLWNNFAVHLERSMSLYQNNTTYVHTTEYTHTALQGYVHCNRQRTKKVHSCCGGCHSVQCSVPLHPHGTPADLGLHVFPSYIPNPALCCRLVMLSHVAVHIYTISLAMT